MRRVLLLLGLGMVWMACSSFTAAPSEDTTDPSADAAVDAAPAACPSSSTRIRPIATFAVTGAPLDDASPPQAVACDLDNALVDDGKLAGLDRVIPGGKAAIAGRPVAGCVGVRFADDVVLDYVTLLVAPVGDACGASPCMPNDPDGGCGSYVGLQLAVFSGATADDLSGYEQLRYNVRPAAMIYRVVPGAHVVVVCRGGEVAVTRDDVGVDAIWANCSR